MKKIILCLIGIFSLLGLKAQDVEGDKGIFYTSIEVNDSIVDTIYQGTIPDVDWVVNYVANNSPSASEDTIFVSGPDKWVGNNDTIDTVAVALVAVNAVTDSVYLSLTGIDSVKSALFYGDSADISKGKFDSIKIEGIDNAFIYSSASETSDLYISNDGTNLLIKDNGSITFNSVGGFGLNTSSLVLSTLGTSKTEGAFYTGTEDPTNTGRLNLDANLHTTGFKADTIYGDTVSGVRGEFDSFSIGGGDVLTSSDTIDLKSAVEAESFSQINLDTATVTYLPGTMSYCPTNQNIKFYNDQSELSWDIGREMLVRFYNNTGSTITNGTVLRSIGSKVNGVITFEADLAGNSSLDSMQGVAVATVDVLNGEFGEATILGQVNGLNTSAYSDNDLLWISHAGTFTNTTPQPPLYSYPFARVVYADADSGAIYIFPGGETRFRPLPIYSSYFTDSTITITNPGLADYANITNATNSAFIEDINYGFIEAGDSIRPLQAGIYNVSIYYSAYTSAVQTDIYEIGVFKNAVRQYKQDRSFSQNSVGGVPFVKKISLTTSDWISFRIANTGDGTRSSIFTDAVVSLEYITQE